MNTDIKTGNHLFANEEHFMKCEVCQQLFDMRNLQEVFEHEHDEDLKKPDYPHYGERKTTQP